MKYYDCIIVLGEYMPGGEASRALTALAELAAKCWTSGLAPCVIVCGGKRGDELFPECEWLALELNRAGVPMHLIHMDAESTNTLENITNAKAIMDVLEAKDALLVTSNSHLPRALAVCRGVGLRAVGRGSEDGTPLTFKRRLTEFLGVVEYKLGLQKRDNGVSRLFRKILKV